MLPDWECDAIVKFEYSNLNADNEASSAWEYKSCCKRERNLTPETRMLEHDKAPLPFPDIKNG
jgi:hypothetical protein